MATNMNTDGLPPKDFDQLQRELVAAEKKWKKLQDLVVANEQTGQLLMELRTEAQKGVSHIKDEVLEFMRQAEKHVPVSGS